MVTTAGWERERDKVPRAAVISNFIAEVYSDFYLKTTVNLATFLF
jgi:hypothetical protein